MKLKCKKCGYGWDYKGSKEWYATCPNCLFKVPLRQHHDIGIDEVEVMKDARH